MSIVIPFSERAKIASSLSRRSDSQSRRPFLVVRTTARDIAKDINIAADEEKRRIRLRMEADARRDCMLSMSPAQTAAYLRSLANLIEAEGSDAS